MTTQPDPRDDLELIDAINGGDASAFDVLYYRYRDWAAGLAHRFTGNRDDALDVMQDAFLYLLGKFPGFALTASLKTFLYPALKHLAAQRRRKDRREVSADGSTIAAIPAPPEARSGSDDLVQVVSILSPELSETLLLRVVDGLSLQEVAAALDIPLGTAKSRLHRAVAILRDDERTRKYFDR